MGHQLRSMGVEIKGVPGTLQRFLGVAVAVKTQPQLVREAHQAFVDAGAKVIITNNYACTPSILAQLNDGKNDAQ